MGYRIDKKDHREINLTVVKGDTLFFKINKYTEDLLRYVPVEEDIVTFEIWNRYTDEEPVFAKQLSTDMLLTITAEECEQFDYRSYVYSVKIEYVNGVVDTFLSGKFNVVEPGEDR